MVSEPVKPYFTRFLRGLSFCLGVSKIVILKENGVVKCKIKFIIEEKEVKQVQDGLLNRMNCNQFHIFNL